MDEPLQSELFASIATLDQLKKMYDMGVIDIRSYERESEALIAEVRNCIEQMRRTGLDIGSFVGQARSIRVFS